MSTSAALDILEKYRASIRAPRSSKTLAFIVFCAGLLLISWCTGVRPHVVTTRVLPTILLCWAAGAGLVFFSRWLSSKSHSTLWMKRLAAFTRWLGGLAVGAGILFLQNPTGDVAPIVFSAYAFIGCSLLIYSRFLWVPNVFAVLNGDHRKPVLYLRSFANDTNPGNFREITLRLFAIASLVGHILRFQFRQVPEDWRLVSRPSAEHRLYPLLRGAVGPVLSLARPTERIGGLGPSRIIVADDAWQILVTELIKVSELIVVDAAGTRALLWELQQVAATDARRKLIIALPLHRLKAARDPAVYETIRSFVSKTFQYELPRMQANLAFLSFSSDGNVVEHRVPGFSVSRCVLGTWYSVMAEVLRSAGYPVRPYAVKIRRTIGQVLVYVSFLFAVVAALKVPGYWRSIDPVNEAGVRKSTGEQIIELAGVIESQVTTRFLGVARDIREFVSTNPTRQSNVTKLLGQLTATDQQVQSDQKARQQILREYNNIAAVDRHLASALKSLVITSPVSVQTTARSIEADILQLRSQESTVAARSSEDQVTDISLGSPYKNILEVLQQYRTSKIVALEAMVAAIRNQKGMSEAVEKLKSAGETKRKLDSLLIGNGFTIK